MPPVVAPSPSSPAGEGGGWDDGGSDDDREQEQREQQAMAGGGAEEGEEGEEERAWREKMGELKRALAACDDGTKVCMCVRLDGVGVAGLGGLVELAAYIHTHTNGSPP